MEATAQDGYRLMLREFIAPALRELGFRRGPSPGAFRYETATHAAEARFRKSRYSSKQRVNFWVDLHASDTKTEWVYWDRTLDGLAHCRSTYPHPPCRIGARFVVGPFVRLADTDRPVRCVVTTRSAGAASRRA